MNFSAEEIFCLQTLGIDIINPGRNYWFVRTDSGEYFDEFFLGGYVGIQWNKVLATPDTPLEELEASVRDNYPEETRPGYVAKQIKKFYSEFKKGDIVLIPNKGSKYIAFGEIIEEEVSVVEESTDATFEELVNGDNPPLTVYQKRRSVSWIRALKRSSLDPYLQSFIYAHNTIVDLRPYALFIDRTLSGFYIKGEECYYSYTVNKPSDIPYGKMLAFLLANGKVADYINEKLPNVTRECGAISLDELSVKINVQSKGPIQLVGPMKKALAFGLIVTALMGGEIEFKFLGAEFNMRSDGIIALMQEIRVWHDSYSDGIELSEDERQIRDALEQSKSDLRLTVPGLSSAD